MVADIPVFDALNLGSCALCAQDSTTNLGGIYASETAAVRYFTCENCCLLLSSPQGLAFRHMLLLRHRARANQCLRDGIQPAFHSVKEALCIS